MRFGNLDAHAVERAVDEDERDHEEDRCQQMQSMPPVSARQLDGQLDGQQAEQRGELDDRVQRDRGGVLERVAHRIANDRGVVQRRAFLLQLDFDDLLGVVPGAAGVGHEDGLVEAEDGDGDQVADEEERLDEREGQRGEENGDEDVEHALLRVLACRSRRLSCCRRPRLFSMPSSLILALMNSTAR